MLAIANAACSVQTEEFNSTEASGSVHAVLRVRRVEMLDGAAQRTRPQGEALAAFVRVPPSVHPDQLLRIAGLWQEHPEVGQCAVASSTVDATWDEDESGELIAAESVDLVTEGNVHALAPHAFPSAYDLLRGVLFSSRDQSALGLPENQPYELVGNGIDLSLPATDVRAFSASPKLPTGVRISNRPFEDGSDLPAQAVLDFSWESETATTDLIVVSIVSDTQHYECSFTDAEGFGSVPLTSSAGQAVWTPGTSAQIAVHRVREAKVAHPQFAQLRTSFDFSIEKSWTLSDGTSRATQPQTDTAGEAHAERPAP
ncbi:MAG TPA: hypothetical protein VN764_16855 [Polyangiaceae bacterium]|nr:hypothetical protein [Polyangiaceae bacterium]